MSPNVQKRLPKWIYAGEDASHLLAKLQLELDEPEPATAVAPEEPDAASEKARRKQRRAALRAKRDELRLMVAKVERSIALEEPKPSSSASHPPGCQGGGSPREYTTSVASFPVYPCTWFL